MVFRLFPYILIFIPFALLYWDTFSRLFKGWFSYEESHGLLILGISIYFIWKKKGLLKKINPNPSLFYGTILLVFACFIFIAGKLSFTHIIQDSSLVFSLLGIILLVGGSEFFKNLLISISYLIFMFPVFSELLGNFSIYLQQITALIAANLLKILGMPVLRSAQFIELPHISLEVAQACNGINHIMALVALSVPLAIISHSSLFKRGLLMLIAFVIGTIANGLRVALIGIWSAYKKSGPLHGPHDIFYVSFIFFFGMGLLLIVNHWFNKRSTDSSSLALSSRYSPFTLIRGKGERDAESKKEVFIRPVLIGALIFLLTLSCIHFHGPVPILLGKPLTSLPTSISQWQGKDISQAKDFLNKIKADEYLNRVYQTNLIEEAEVFIRYFSIQEKGKSITDYRFHFPNYHWETVPVKVENSILKINKMKNFNHDKNEKIYFWYEIGGKTISHHYLVKYELFKNSLLSNNTSGAFIFVAFKGKRESKDEVVFLQKLITLLKEYLP